MVNGRIIWRYLSIALGACFCFSFYSWYSLTSSQARDNPTSHTIIMPKQVVQKSETWLKKDSNVDDEQQRNVNLDDGLEKRFLNGETDKRWLPKFYADEFNNNSSLSYLRRRIVEYCNPPGKAITGKEGVVLSGYGLQSVHVLIRHGDRTPMDGTGMNSQADINCNLMVVSDTSPDHMFELLATDLNEWKELLQKTDELMLSDLELKASLKTSAVSSLDLKYLSATISDSSSCRTSQLTPNGWRQHLAIGAFLRKAYVNHNLLNPEDVDYKKFMNLHTTFFSRTMQSAIALLYGLLPEDQILKTPPLKKTRFLNFCQANMCNCPAAFQFLNQVSSEKLKHKKQHSYTRQITTDMKMTLYGNQKGSPKLPHFFALLDHFTSFLCHDQKLPCGPTKCVDLDQVQKIFEYIDKLQQDLNSQDDSPSTKHARLFMHPLLKDIADAIMQNTTNHRFSLYSGHDLTITPFLGILGLPDFSWPNYASRIVIEAWSKLNIKFIRVLYNGVDMTSKLRFCRNELNQDGLCPLTKLINFLNHENFDIFNANSYDKACLSTNT